MGVVTLSARRGTRPWEVGYVDSTHPPERADKIEEGVETIQCRRCGEDAPRLEKPPFRTELGTRIQEAICQSCWQDWLQHQTLLINHYGLDPRDPKSREFLYEQIEKVLLKGGEGAEVDTSQEGSIEW